MLPALSAQQTVPPLVLDFTSLLTRQGFQGEIETSYASRLTVATDNSVYQLLPQAVIFPQSHADVVLLAQLSAKPEFSAIAFCPRGGGTGTNGQALGVHIVVDLSRHLRQILDINIEQGWVRVQAGVVKDALNEQLKPYGFFFAPELSTSNRATLGGMISTDACGQGSLRYGKTSAHVLSVKAVFADGSELDTGAQSLTQLAQLAPTTAAHRALQQTATLCQTHRALIERKFPPLNRFLTGYDLKHAYQPETEQFDLTRILCGAEGTLAFITEATLAITPMPKKRALVAINYLSFDAALKSAPMLVAANALSVETIDSNVLERAKNDIIWHQVNALFADTPLSGLNLVEFAGDEQDVDQGVSALCTTLDAAISDANSAITGYQCTKELSHINSIYAMRKKAVGLLGAGEGAAKPIAFVEDTCVPPEHLADFIREFRQILDEHQLHYGMFGHVDAGVLHVRPALDLCDPTQEKLMHQISDQVAKLVQQYGGLIWGEHGKGFRSEYGPEFFGPELFNLLRQVKTACDPHNQMNPGKICTPLGNELALAAVNGPKRAHVDKQIPLNVREHYALAMACNGNGLCFNYELHSPMCPSMKVSYDRRFSPKGRAGLIREWLRLLTLQGVDPVALETELLAVNQPLSFKALFEKFKIKLGPQTYPDDFSHQVKQAMDTCLACKACASQCPVKVDIPSFRARFLLLYHSRYRRPLKDHLVANIERLLPWMAKLPQLVNGVTQAPLSKKLSVKAIGYIDIPQLSIPTLSHLLQHYPSVLFNFNQLEKLSASERANTVLIVQDPFTSYYEAELVRDFVELAIKLGKNPIIVPFHPNGKALHIKGFLREFARVAASSASFLNQLSTLNMPMVGLDPALVLCYRDEYKQILGDKRGAFKVLMSHEWLAAELKQGMLPAITAERARGANRSSLRWHLLSHCTEKTYAPDAEKIWQHIFAQFGAQLDAVAVGCCGMAGTYGHEVAHYATSVAIYQLSWQQALAKLPLDQCVATGYSCRSQVKRREGKKLRHPVQALLSLLGDNNMKTR